MLLTFLSLHFIAHKLHSTRAEYTSINDRNKLYKNGHENTLYPIHSQILKTPKLTNSHCLQGVTSFRTTR